MCTIYQTEVLNLWVAILTIVASEIVFSKLFELRLELAQSLAKRIMRYHKDSTESGQVPDKY